MNYMPSGFWSMIALLRTLTIREDGQDLVEYALILALIGLGGFAGIEALAQGILNLFIGIISVININLG
jgi:pilus assembly protein Flp/PilA